MYVLSTLNLKKAKYGVTGVAAYAIECSAGYTGQRQLNTFSSAKKLN